MKVRIPKQLPIKAAGNRAEVKALAAFCLLKAIYPDGNFKDERSSRTNLAYVGGFSERTADRRISQLLQMGLVREKDYSLELVSWSDVSRTYDCYSSRFYHVTISAQTNLELVFDQKTIYEKKQQCKSAWKFRLTKVLPMLGDDLREVSATLDSREVFYHQFNCYRSNGKGYTPDQEINLDVYTHRAEFEVGYKALSKLFGYNGIGSFAYRKRKLEKAGLIEVDRQRIYKLDVGRKTTQDSRITKLGNVSYFRPEKCPVIQLPDKIDILSHNAPKPL